MQLDSIARVVPWALEDWKLFYPALGDLSYVAEKIWSHGFFEHRTIPAKGVTEYPVVAALRPHSDGAEQYDDFARALLISLAVRLKTDKSNTLLKQSSEQASYPCIEYLSLRIRGFKNDDNRSRRGPWFQQAAEESDSPKGYLIALAQACLTADKPDKKLCAALAHSAMRVFGLPPLEVHPPSTQGPKPPVKPQPRRETGTNEGQKSVRERVEVREISVPIADPDDDSPEAHDEALQKLPLVRRNRTSRKPLGYKDFRAIIRGQMRAQSISSAGESFLLTHIDALAPAECKSVAKELIRRADEELNQQNPAGAARYVLLALMLSTGLTVDRATALLQRTQGDPPFIHGNRLTLQSMLPDSAYEPKDNSQNLMPVDKEFSVDLPPSLAQLLSRVRPWLKRQPQGLSLSEALGEMILEVRLKTGLHHVSAGKIRKSYAVLIHEEQRDYCATATLAQDTFRLSPAPLHYYSVQSDVLASLYRRAIWPIFGDSPAAAPEAGQSTRIGTKALAKPGALKSASRLASRPLHAHTDRNDPASVARTHNALVAHIAAMLISVVGHRHSNALFRLNRWDFDLELAAANVADKMSDPAHLRRLVGLGEHVARQIAFYLLHLDEACKLDRMEHFGRRATAALTGKQSLFFRLNEADAQPLEADLDWLRSQLTNFPDIPTNRGRHYLGSIGRESKDNPNLIAIQLGHYESVGYPWSPDSPMVPKQFIESVNPILDSAFNEQGRTDPDDKRVWQIQAGLATARPETRSESPSSQENSWARTGPMVDWHQANLTFAREARKRNLLVRRTRWFRQHQIQHETEQSVVTIASSLDISLADLIAYWVNERQLIRKKQDAQLVTLPGLGIRHPDRLPNPVEPADETVEALFSQIGDQFTDPEAAVLAHNTAARALAWAYRQGLYRGLIHSPWLPLRPLDLSPFTPGLFRATTQVRLLRDHLEQIGRESSGERDSSRGYIAGVAALWLAVDGGIDNPELLEELISGDCGIYPVPAVPDAVVVHCRELKHSCGLRGLAAISYLTWRQRAQKLGRIPRLEKCLDQVLPAAARTARTNLVRALCSTVSMNNRIQRSGMTNHALDLENGCTSLEEDQLAELLGSECQAPMADADPEPTLEAAVSGDIVENNAALFDLREEYNHLLHLHHDSKDVELPFSGRIWRYDHANTGPERNKIIEEARLAAENSDWSWYGRYWALWIKEELTRPKLTKPDEQLAYSSVFDRYSETARRMRDLLARRSGKHLETPPTTEFLEHLYELILEDAPTSTQQRICRSVLSFHEYVAAETGIDDIDPSDYWEFWRPTRQERSTVRSRIPYTAELEAIEAALLRYAEPDSELEELGNIDRRIIREALLAFRLAMDSGARIGEIAGLRTIDTILVDGKTGLLIRSNRRRPLKTRAARRIIDISEHIPVEIRALLVEHIQAERADQPKRKRDQTWLFADSSGRPVPAEEHRKLVNQVAIIVTGRPLRWHGLRHRQVCERLCRFVLGVGLDELLLPQSEHLQPKLRTPRGAAAIRAQIGHARLRTSLETYFHLPWAFQLSEYTAASARAGELACALATNRSAAYCRLRSCDRRLDQIAAREIRSTLGNSTTQIHRETSAPHIYISSPQDAPRLCLGLHALGQGVDEESVLYRPGLSQGEIDRLRSADLNLAMRTGIGIFRENPYASTRHSRPPKWLATARQLQDFWARLELDGDSQVKELAAIWQTHAQSGLRHGLGYRREPRAHIFWPTDKLSILRKEVRALELKADVLVKTSAIAVVRIQDSEERNVTSETVWTLAICSVVQQAASTDKNS